MTDRLFADCCYGSDQQHLPGATCPQEGALLPCPFCGGEARNVFVIGQTYQHSNCYQVICVECGAQTEQIATDDYGSGKPKTAALWNAREKHNAAQSRKGSAALELMGEIQRKLDLHKVQGKAWAKDGAWDFAVAHLAAVSVLKGLIAFAARIETGTAGTENTGPARKGESRTAAQKGEQP